MSYRNFEREADERIARSLDILHEHALNVLQTVERTFAEINEITRGMSDDDIHSNEERLHARLKRIDDALPQVQGIAIIDGNGHALVSANLFPVPQDLNFSDRDYFQALAKGNPGTYMSSMHEPRMAGLGGYFFALAHRRPSDDGQFNGVVSVAVLPTYFEDFKPRWQQRAMCLRASKNSKPTTFPSASK